MIKINRDDDCPPMLARGVDIDNLACHGEVVDKLHTMQHGKCCYCEKKIAKEGAEQAIEHFRPQAQDKYPKLKNEWTNLLHSCANCNNKKRSKFPVDANNNPLFINPSEPSIDPEYYFDFEIDDEDESTFGRIKAKNDSNQAETTIAETTIKEIGLDIVDRRRERCSIYMELYRAYIEIIEAHQAGEGITKGQKIRAFETMLGANYPYAAFARAFARKKNLVERFNIRIPQGAEVAA